MSVISALYLILLAAVAGYVLIARVPSLLHTPMLSGSNFIHGIVLAGAMLALSNATGTFESTIGFIAVMAAAANVVGGFIVTDRMLNLFEQKDVSVTNLMAADRDKQATGNIVDKRVGKPVDSSAESSKPTSKGHT